MKGALARTTLKTTALLGLRVATQAASLLLLTHLLSVEIYGRLIAAASLAMILGILSSLGSGYVMMVLAPQRGDAIAHVWRYAWPLTLTFSLVLLSIYLPSARAIGGTQALPIAILLWIGGTEIIAIPFVNLFSFALQAREQVPLSQVVQWLPFGLRALVILPCFMLDDTDRLHGYVVYQLLASFAGLLIGAAISNRYLKLDWRPRLITAGELRSGASFSGMHLIAANSSDLDKVLAIRLVEPADAGIYAATSRVASALVMPVTALLLSAQSRVFRHAHQPTLEGKRLIQLLGMLAATWGAVSWLLLSITSSLLPLLFGPSFIAMEKLMPLFAVVALPLSLRHSAGAILVALGKPGTRVCFELVGLATLFCAMYALAPRGISGLATALIISESSMALVGWLLIYRLKS